MVRLAFRWFMRAICGLSLLFVSAPGRGFGDEITNAPTPPRVELEQTNFLELLQVIMQLQGQLRTNQLAIEQSEQESREAANRNAETLSNGLHKLESAFSTQQETLAAQSERELEAMQSLNRSLVITAGTIASVAFLSVLVTGYLQWRTTRVWAEISRALRNPPAGIRGSAVGDSSLGQPGPASSASLEDSNVLLLGTIEQLEKRIRELEKSSKPALITETAREPSSPPARA